MENIMIVNLLLVHSSRHIGLEWVIHGEWHQPIKYRDVWNPEFVDGNTCFVDVTVMLRLPRQLEIVPFLVHTHHT